ncbi:pancreatic lipase-related protein 3 [Bombyx mori]|uniref:Lipase domain-containing protein n=1 Tax=Bombyx mori TaxID=7091 RepID=A0A8R1WI61_BOMMO|nr:pancreatic lipase-related protein 3 isoform X2 [Bombyx mori]
MLRRLLYSHGFFLCIITACLSCVTPPLECPNKNITFWLYTRANEHSPHQLLADDNNSITEAPWVTDAPIKILIHGYTGHRDFSPNTEIRPAYMKCCDYNVISVDYNNIALEPCYLESARNTELVGKCTAQLIDNLIKIHGFKMQRFHVIGFSLGAQTAGYMANYLINGRLSRITALDPAMPLFVTTDNSRKVDMTDADFVDVLHTNALEKGKLEASGHVDFYANGGLTQPGCKASEEQTKSGCDHARAPIYYAESIITDVGFYATKCFSWITYMIGWCELINSSDEILFGEYVSLEVTGFYFFPTNFESPFAKGLNHRNTRDLLSQEFNKYDNGI